ncbi:MAG: hypothetical protein H6513_05560 [Acidimicrobiaceae bacterium]|nr:hypothetical protein [Acidimicrobiaceae bacterium]
MSQHGDPFVHVLYRRSMNDDGIDQPTPIWPPCVFSSAVIPSTACDE